MNLRCYLYPLVLIINIILLIYLIYSNAEKREIYLLIISFLLITITSFRMCIDYSKDNNYILPIIVTLSIFLSGIQIMYR